MKTVRWSRGSRFLLVLIAGVAGAGLIDGCHKVVAVTGDAPLHAIAGGGEVHGFAQPYLAQCASMSWTATCDDPIFTDDQAFRIDGGVYGPHTYIAPSPSLGAWTTETDFATPRLVALVYVKAPAGTTLPAQYTSLRLSAGSNCVYLRYVLPDSLLAYVEPATAPCPTSYTPDETKALKALPVSNPNPWNTGSHSAQAANIPAVARFYEGQAGVAASPHTIPGFRCGDRWCLVQPLVAVTALGSLVAGEHADWRTWAINGWSDAQHVAEESPTGPLKPGNSRVAILPDTDLASKTFAPPAPGDHPGDEQHVATIVFRGQPSGVYDSVWHLRSGKNHLFIWRDASGNWQGEIQNKRLGIITNHIPVYVEQRHVGSNPPATARMRWSYDDEDYWVACSSGCCYVSGRH